MENETFEKFRPCICSLYTSKLYMTKLIHSLTHVTTIIFLLSKYFYLGSVLTHISALCTTTIFFLKLWGEKARTTLNTQKNSKRGNKNMEKNYAFKLNGLQA